MPLFGIGQQKPHHYLEMAKIAWENRDQLPFAWRILGDGVCDGCALGTSGLSDWTLPGTHLCMVLLLVDAPQYGAVTGSEAAESKGGPGAVGRAYSVRRRPFRHAR